MTHLDSFGELSSLSASSEMDLPTIGRQPRRRSSAMRSPTPQEPPTTEFEFLSLLNSDGSTRPLKASTTDPAITSPTASRIVKSRVGPRSTQAAGGRQSMTWSLNATSMGPAAHAAAASPPPPPPSLPPPMDRFSLSFSDERFGGGGGGGGAGRALEPSASQAAPRAARLFNRGNSAKLKSKAVLPAAAARARERRGSRSSTRSSRDTTGAWSPLSLSLSQSFGSDSSVFAHAGPASGGGVTEEGDGDGDGGVPPARMPMAPQMSRGSLILQAALDGLETTTPVPRKVRKPSCPDNDAVVEQKMRETRKLARPRMSVSCG